MHRLCAIIIVSMLVTLGGLQTESQGADGPKRVTLLPITSDNAGKYSQLGDALRLMIAGRLSAKDSITVVENSLDRKERSDLPVRYPENAGDLFSRFQVDYIGAGSIIDVDGAMDLQMTFYNKEGDAPVVVESRAQNEQEVMAAVDSLLEKIAEKVFNQAPQGTPLPAQAARKKGMEAFQTEHPDRKYKKEILSGKGIFAEDAEIMFSRDDMLRRSVALDDAILAVDVEDLDNDGTSEIIVASENGVRVYRYDRGLLEQVAILDADVSIHSMGIGDINDDGIMEISLSALNDDRFSSMVVAWTQATGFKTIADSIDYAVRILEIPGQGARLIGQRRSDDVETFFEDGIFYLELDGQAGDMRPAKDLFLPPAFTIFDFTYADIDGDGDAETVRISNSMNVEVYDSDNRIIWVSGSGYGGRDLYLGSRWLQTTQTTMSQTQAGEDGEYYHNLEYLPVQPVAVDINGDGKQEILTARNSLATFTFLRNLRKFSDGRVVCLGWNGQEMQEMWQTEMLGGYVSSIAFEELANSMESQQKSEIEEAGERAVRMYVVQAPAQNLADVLNFSGDTSNLVVYDFKILEQSSISPKESE